MLPAAPKQICGSRSAAAAGFDGLQDRFYACLAVFGHYKVYGPLGAVIAFMFFVLPR